MKFHLRNVAMALVLLAGVSVAAAQTSTMDTALQLSAAQKAQIYRTLSAEGAAAGAKTATSEPGVRVAVGAPLPPNIELLDVPSATIAQIPAMGRFKYALLGDDVVIVDPSSRQIVEVIREQ